MAKLAATTWCCPYCDYRVPYGAGCASDDLATCTLGKKNLHYEARLKREKANGNVGPVTSIGIAEIANDEIEDDEEGM